MSEENKSIINNLIGRQKSFYLALTLCIFVIFGGIYLLATPRSDTKTDSEDNATDPKTSENTVIDNPIPKELQTTPPNSLVELLGITSLPNDSICGLTPGDTGLNANFDSNTSWKTVSGVLVPTSDSLGGNTVNNSGFRTCYQFSSAGAVAAAMDFFAAGQKAETRSELNELSIDNTGNAPKKSEGDAANAIRFEGYRITDTYPNAVSVDLLLSTPQKGNDLYHMTMPLTWKDGDWKMQTIDGTVNDVPRIAASTSSYTMIGETN